MKRADSRFIKTFLACVRADAITGQGRSGPVVLQNMVDALQSILEGADFDTALKIERKPGGPEYERTYILAVIMRAHMKGGDKVVVAEEYANIWLEAVGGKRLTARRMRTIRKQHHARIQAAESISVMVRKVQQAIEKAE